MSIKQCCLNDAWDLDNRSCKKMGVICKIRQQTWLMIIEIINTCIVVLPLMHLLIYPFIIMCIIVGGWRLSVKTDSLRYNFCVERHNIAWLQRNFTKVSCFTNPELHLLDTFLARRNQYPKTLRSIVILWIWTFIFAAVCCILDHRRFLLCFFE